jgi:hypothetical protein
MPGVIDRQIESLHTSAGEAVAAADAGNPATARCREVDDLLSVAVALYERTREGVRTWQESVSDWEATGWVEQARSFEARYRKLQEAFARISRVLGESEAGGCLPETTERFRRAKVDLDLLCQLSVDRMLKSDESFRQGRGRTMAEVRDELRRRLGA